MGKGFSRRRFLQYTPLLFVAPIFGPSTVFGEVSGPQPQENGPVPVSVPQHMQWIWKRVYQYDVKDKIKYDYNIPVAYNTWHEPGTTEEWEGIVFFSNRWGDAVYKLNHLSSGGPEQWTLEVVVIGWHENEIYCTDSLGYAELILRKPATPDFGVPMSSYISKKVSEKDIFFKNGTSTASRR